MEILTHLITTGDIGAARVSLSSSKGALGDETADLISRLIGLNALTRIEMETVLALIRAAFEKPEAIAPDAKAPVRTLAFLRHQAGLTHEDSIKQQIAGAISYVQAQ